MSHGCPECGRTPVVYVLSSKIWTCKSCRCSWREEDGEKEPVYFIADMPEEKKQAFLSAPASKESGKPSKKKPGRKKAIPEKL